MRAAAFELASYLEAGGARVEAALARALEAAAPDLGRLAPAVRDGVLSGGKRIRPILVAAAWEAVRGDRAQAPDAVYDLGAALEMIHAYSLMHDDLPCMDDAPLRRGRPTPHVVHGVEAATRAGLLLIPLAARQAWTAARALGLTPPEAGAVVVCLCRAAGGTGMVAGQVLDLEAEGRHLDEEALTHLHGRKTGALLAASLELGARAAGADPARREALIAYGTAIGLAFQIADDILDRTRSAAALGKRPSDADLGKSTFVALLGLDGARARGAEVVDAARAGLREAGIHSAALDGLAVYILGRER